MGRTSPAAVTHRVAVRRQGEQARQPQQHRRRLHCGARPRGARRADSTIAFGTATGHVAVKNRHPVPVDGDMMKAVAQLSGGQTSTAETIDELNNKFSAVEDQMGFQIARGSASAGWLRLAVIVAGIGAALALLINRRLPV